MSTIDNIKAVIEKEMPAMVGTELKAMLTEWEQLKKENPNLKSANEFLSNENGRLQAKISNIDSRESSVTTREKDVFKREQDLDKTLLGKEIEQLKEAKGTIFALVDKIFSNPVVKATKLSSHSIEGRDQYGNPQYTTNNSNETVETETK